MKTIDDRLQALQHPEIREYRRGIPTSVALWIRTPTTPPEGGLMSDAGGTPLGIFPLEQMDEAGGFLDNYSRADGPLQGHAIETGLGLYDHEKRLLSVEIHYRDPQLAPRYADLMPQGLTHLNLLQRQTMARFILNRLNEFKAATAESGLTPEEVQDMTEYLLDESRLKVFAVIQGERQRRAVAVYPGRILELLEQEPEFNGAATEIHDDTGRVY